MRADELHGSDKRKDVKEIFVKAVNDSMTKVTGKADDGNGNPNGIDTTSLNPKEIELLDRISKVIHQEQ